jgi:hypothetical protein
MNAGSASWLCLAAFASTISTTIACITAAAAATAFSDVVADSIVVELARASPGATEGALQSLCWWVLTVVYQQATCQQAMFCVV